MQASEEQVIKLLGVSEPAMLTTVKVSCHCFDVGRSYAVTSSIMYTEAEWWGNFAQFC